MLQKMAEKLAKARKSVGLNQDYVAERVGISRSTMIKIEKGDTPVDVILLGKLAHEYGYSIEFFLDDQSTEDTDFNFAFRATELSEEDSYLPAWGRRLLLNIRSLQQIAEEAGL